MVANIKTVFYITIIFAISLQSCSTSEYMLYAPSAHTAPFLKSKGDNQISASVSTNKEGETYKSIGTRVQGAYAITNNIALTGAINYQFEKDFLAGYDFSMAQNNESRDWSTLRYKRKDAELGIGYYKPFGSKHQLSFNVFTGVGFGQVNVKESFVYRGRNDIQILRHSHNQYKWYLHPSLAVMPGKVFRLSVGSRFTLAHFNAFKSELTSTDLTNRDWYASPRSIVFVEPSLNLQVAIIPDMLSVHFGGSVCGRFTTKDPYSENADIRDYSRRFILFTGLTFEIGKRKIQNTN